MSEEKQEQRLLGGSWNILPPDDKTPDSDSLAINNFRVDQAGVLRVTAPPVPATTLSPAAAAPIVSIFTAPFLGASTRILYDGYSFWLKDAPGYSDFNQKLTNNTESNGYVSQPLGFVPWLRSGYILNPWFAKKLGFVKTGSAFLSDWMPPVPTSAPGWTVNAGAGYIDAGYYTYYVTFGGNNGQFQGDPVVESNPGAAIAQVIVPQDSSAVFLYNIPTWPGSGYIFPHRRIYRAGGPNGALAAPYQVADIIDNTTTTFTDYRSNTDILETGIQMASDNSQPPHARGLVGPYLGRMIAFNSPSFPNRFWWTKINYPTWPGSESGDYFDPNNPGNLGQSGSQPGNWADVGNDYQVINAVTVHSRLIVFYTNTQIWRLFGDPATGTLEQTSSAIGIPVFGQNLVANAGNKDYFYSSDGIFVFNLDSQFKVSQKIEPLFFGSLPITGSVLTQVFQVQTPIRLQYLNGILLFSYVDTSGAYRAIVWHEETNRWAQLSSSSGITEVCTLGSSVNFVTGHANGQIGAPDLTQQSVAVAFQTKFLDQQHPDTPKLYTELVIDHELLNGSTLSIQALFDSGNGTPQSFSITGTGRTKTHLALGTDGTWGTTISVLISGNAPVGAAIHAVYIYYYLDSRITVSDVSRPFSFGSPTDIYEVKELELDAMLAGAGTIKLSSDVPNVNSLAVQFTASVAAGSRRNYQIPVNPHVDGRIFQLAHDCPAGARIYGGKMLARKYGCYVENYDAAAGYVWEHTPTDFGANDDKVFDQLQLDLDAGGLLTPQIFVDQPTDVFGLAQTFALNATSGRRWYTLEVTNPNVHGKLFMLKIPSAVGYKLYRGRVRFRRIGRYFSNAVNDQLRTLEQDFGTERVKLVKKFEIDIQTSGPVTFTVWADDPTSLNSRTSFTIDTGGIRKTVRQDIAGNNRGRIWRIDAAATGWARLYGIRAWMRRTGENSNIPWDWASFAVEPSQVLPTWADLPIPETSPVFDWLPIPVPFGQVAGL